MITCDPGPLDSVAGVNGNGAEHEVGPTLPDVHIRRRRASEVWKKGDRKSQQTASHVAWKWYFHNSAIPLFAPVTGTALKLHRRKSRQFWYNGGAVSMFFW